MFSVEILKQQLREKYMPVKSLKVFSNGYAVNSKLEFIKSLDKGVRGVCSQILDFFEARVNTDIEKESYMIVYASQQQIADQLGYTREYISTCISSMCSMVNCPFKKVRQGLNKANYYIMETKKELIELLQNIYSAENKEKIQEKKTYCNKYPNTKSKKSDFVENCATREEYSKPNVLNELELALTSWQRE